MNNLYANRAVDAETDKITFRYLQYCHALTYACVPLSANRTTRRHIHVPSRRILRQTAMTGTKKQAGFTAGLSQETHFKVIPYSRIRLSVFDHFIFIKKKVV